MADSAALESIFISYRRSDSRSATERIYDRLKAKFGKDLIFKDASSILGGTDFAVRLEQAVSQCKMLLVIIGKTWLTVTNADGTRRLDNPEDWVRIEIEAALNRDIPVIPVLIEGAKMPSKSELPESLQRLARRHYVEIGNDPRFDEDANRLIADIQRHLGMQSGDENLGETAQDGHGSSNVQINNSKGPVFTGNISGSTINIDMTR